MRACVNLHLSDSVLRERTGALLLRPALHKSPLYVDKVSATLRPPPASSSLPAPSAMFTRPPGGSPEQSGSLLITLDYFHSPGVSQAFRQGAGEEGRRERDGLLTKSRGPWRRGACLLSEQPVPVLRHRGDAMGRGAAARACVCVPTDPLPATIVSTAAHLRVVRRSLHQFYGDNISEAGPSQDMTHGGEDLWQDINDLILFTGSAREGVRQAAHKKGQCASFLPR